jgi:hypothetical protein
MGYAKHPHLKCFLALSQVLSGFGTSAFWLCHKCFLALSQVLSGFLTSSFWLCVYVVLCQQEALYNFVPAHLLDHDGSVACTLEGGKIKGARNQQVL